MIVYTVIGITWTDYRRGAAGVPNLLEAGQIVKRERHHTHDDNGRIDWGKKHDDT